ncbi:hypothetical protein H6P81_009194 [Aristolochia fimbriata]|uniref:Uncharacterized protein n=1 Tax=Aristolochia fimbriata TaxID=158543 RepID=A0AAV7ELI0_ARIFI|nr:hypothetical protein H6P81_009194 [Aristolochia fimbriata]
MALRSFYNEIRNLKVREVPSYLKPKLTVDYVKNAINRGMDNYHRKSVATWSISSTRRSTATDRLMKKLLSSKKRDILLVNYFPFEVLANIGSLL